MSFSNKSRFDRRQSVVQAGQMQRSALVALALLPFTLGMQPAEAAEGASSPYMKGFGGYMAGFVPPQPGLFIPTLLYYHLDGTVGASVRNGRAEFGVDAKVDAGLVSAAYLTDWKLLGGSYGFGGALGVVGADITASLHTAKGTVGVSEATSGLGDSLIEPVMLSWHSGNLHMSSAFLVYVPTGDYDVSKLSVGKNYWAFIPQFAMTWFDPASGWDVSGSAAVVFPTENNATQYQTGDIFHFDWAVGKHLGDWEIGIQGNFMQQLSGDSGPGASLGSFEISSIGIGPAVSYSAKAGQMPLVISAKWEPDVAATNTFKGNIFSLSLTAVL
jgi:hypothetical protein